MKRSLLVAVATLVLAAAPVWAGVQNSKTSNTSSKSSSSMSSTTHKQATSQTHVKSHKLRGTVESLTSDQLSIKTASGKEDTFVLQPSTKRNGDIAVGTRVTVWYTEQNGAKDATQIVAAKISAMSHSKMSSNTKSSTGYRSNATTSKSGKSTE